MARSDTGGITWGVTEELLAQMIEEVSVLTADRRRRKPRTVLRPFDTPAPHVEQDRHPGRGRRVGARGAAHSPSPHPAGPPGHQALLAMARSGGRVRRG